MESLTSFDEIKGMTHYEVEALKRRMEFLTKERSEREERAQQQRQNLSEFHTGTLDGPFGAVHPWDPSM